MIKKEFTVFKYQYEFEPMLLRDFIEDRYVKSRKKEKFDRIFPERIKVNEKEVNDQTIINTGDWIEYKHYRTDESDLVYTPNVIYEDEFIVAISKPDFVPVSPSGKYYFNSLAIRMKEFCDNSDLSPIHRLDLETSGILLFGKNKRARRKLQPMFEKKKINKFYQAVTFKEPSVGEISGDIVPAESEKIFTKLKLVPSENPNSLTKIHKTEDWGDYFRVWLSPITGKTNQLRVHLADVGCPIVGDKKFYYDEDIYLDWIYNRDISRVLPQLKLERQALHCYAISFFNPLTEEEFYLEDKSGFWEQKIAPLKNIEN